MSADPSQFEEPIHKIRRRIDELSALDTEAARETEIAELQQKLIKVSSEIYSNLNPWQKTLVARHPQRPYTLDYVNILVDDWMEVAGDRKFADDPAIVAGFGKFRGISCCVVGHQKGRNTKEKVIRNFGQPRPEGFRKALRVMKLAEKFRMPVLTFIDTQGAYPGLGAEERGQAEAIAVNLREMAALEVPVIVSVIGEGGSGGALALGDGDRVLMQEHAVYSVISPEGCAAILWKDASAAPDAAAAMKITAQYLKKFTIIDEIVPEPPGGAHSDPAAAAQTLATHIERAIRDLQKLKTPQLLEERYKKFRRMGVFEK